MAFNVVLSSHLVQGGFSSGTCLVNHMIRCIFSPKLDFEMYIKGLREVIDGSQNISLQKSREYLTDFSGGLTIDVPVVSLLTSFKTNPFRSNCSQGIHSNGMGLPVYAEGDH
ncbi:hypothetical protein PROFUN_13370 [Planoprotostelium fungivorum]|uniref:Uncharacterized protein n=1 Tax=Planoprotostelium fungivorum TaxID=1890364 RepID=A0A2P6MZT1_9EUKA|nr:hypothetical protein PROFUN_13370 [Planoprotostelium fungivorum]